MSKGGRVSVSFMLSFMGVVHWNASEGSPFRHSIPRSACSLLRAPRTRPACHQRCRAPWSVYERQTSKRGSEPESESERK